MTFEEVVEQATEILQMRPPPDDAVQRFEALEAALSDQEDLARFGDLWEALYAVATPAMLEQLAGV